MTDQTITPDWSTNCLTAGIHHGRQEALWQLPLRYAALELFTKEELKQLVLARIFDDAMQYAEFGSEQFDEDWAKRVKADAEEHYDRVLQHKIGEIGNYYKSHSWRGDVERAIERVEVGKLNPGYQPLHGHDSINLLCRILGQPASIKASR